MVRACHDLRPEGIVWPRRADADRPSFRLEELTLANGITHEQVHEVLSTPPTQHYLQGRLSGGARAGKPTSRAGKPDTVSDRRPASRTGGY